ncbi:MAG: tetratricopeptide repeat protein [Proteobacteria bacterium]|nr:tetratricopeptide repeat protein [Pseudomonadota bacterium]
MRNIRCVPYSLALVWAFAAPLPVLGQGSGPNANRNSGQGSYTKADLAAARDLFDAGIALFEEGDYARACRKFEASLQLVKGLGTRGRLAECYEKLGRVASAWELYREVEDAAALSGDTLREVVARERAKAIEPRLPYLIIEAEKLAKIATATIEKDGVAIPRGKWNVRLLLDPGNYTVVAFVAGEQFWSIQLTLAESSTVTATVPEPSAPRRRDEAPSSDARPREQTPRPFPERASSTPSGNPRLQLVGRVVVGLGAAGLAVGGYYAWDAHSLWDEAETFCTSMNQCTRPGFDKSRRALDSARNAEIAVGVGFALAAGGALLWWLSRPGEAPESGPARSGMAAAIGNGSASMWVYGRF